MSIHRFLRALAVVGWVIMGLIVVATAGLPWLLWWLMR